MAAVGIAGLTAGCGSSSSAPPPAPTVPKDGAAAKPGEEQDLSQTPGAGKRKLPQKGKGP